jgi:Pyridoxamine 5'-phosphate oxidase
VPANTVSWPEVAARLAAARSYWLSTTMPSGAPDVAPVWGVVISDVLYLYSERRTRKARNLAARANRVARTGAVPVRGHDAGGKRGS